MEANLIESLGIYKFSSNLIKVPGVIPHLQYNDRIPLYDGEIYLYDLGGYTNDFYVGSVKVQVKASTLQDNFQYGFIFKVNDLIKYMNDGGVMILAAFVQHEQIVEMYYRPLLPFQIRDLIPKNMTQKSMRVKVFRLPKETEIIRNELSKFIHLSRRQVSFIGNPLMNLDTVLKWLNNNYYVEINYHPMLSIKDKESLIKKGATIYFQPNNTSLQLPTNGKLYLCD